jgi:ABC-type glutathione transport system ATPase component
MTYKETWRPIREVAEKSGTPYNKAAYDAQVKREAEAAAKKAAEAAAKAARRPSHDGQRRHPRLMTAAVDPPPAQGVSAGQPVLKDISSMIDAAGVTAIIGPSGTGKSTLIRCINRLVDPTAGKSCSRGRIWPSSKRQGPAHGAPAHRHGVSGIQSR